MKPSQILVALRRLSVARASLTIASCVAVAAVALAAPQRLTSSSNSIVRGTQTPEVEQDVSGPDAIPPSMTEAVQVMVELDAPPAGVIYAEALKAAQAAAVDQPVRVPMSAAAKGAIQRVEIDSLSAARVTNQVTAIDAAQQSLLPAIANTGASVIYRTQRAYNGIAVSVAPDRISELAKLPGV